MAGFDERKVTEAAVHLLKLRGDRMSYMKLLKLLYLADREAFHRWGLPITHDRYVSMDNGPVLSRTYNFIREGSEIWSQYISAPLGYYDVELVSPHLEPAKLSSAETKLLDEIFNQHGHKDRWTLVRECHKLPEWQDPEGSSLPIQRSAILMALGESQEDIAAILSELEREENIADMRAARV